MIVYINKYQTKNILVGFVVGYKFDCEGLF